MDYQLIYPELSVINGYEPIERIFASRGIVPEAINHYLNTTDRDINDPLLLNNMERGAKMFIEHLAKDHKIFIQVDSDVDGFTSAAILINYAYRIAPATVQNNFSYRLHEGKCHGILSENVPDGIELVVVPDAGSNDLAEHKKLRDRGIDVLIIDHHEVENPVQFACIINNQLGEYPNRTLSGAGVVYKFCQYIDSVIGQNYADDFLDLAALGMIADMMDLKDTETKRLIVKGLNRINNPFLEAFFEKQAFKLNQEGINPTSIAFYVAPYVNAVNRVGSQEEKLVMFESMLEYKAYEMIPSTKRGHKGEDEQRVEQGCRVCTNAKNHQTKICEANTEMIEEIIQDENLLDHPVLVIQVTDDLDQNITGLLANQIMNKYQRPTLILRPEIEVNDDGEITRFDWMGSGRCPANIKLENFREFISNSGLVNYASGHASAFGISIPEGKVEKLVEYIDARLQVSDFSTTYKVDFIWDAKNIAENKDLILQIGGMRDVWGQGLPEPLVAITNIVLTAENFILMSPDNNPTFKIVLPNNICLIKFKATKEEYEELYSKTGSVKINAIGTCKQNVWNGSISPQIIIKDYQVISRLAYLF